MLSKPYGFFVYTVLVSAGTIGITFRAASRTQVALYGLCCLTPLKVKPTLIPLLTRNSSLREKRIFSSLSCLIMPSSVVYPTPIENLFFSELPDILRLLELNLPVLVTASIQSVLPVHGV